MSSSREQLLQKVRFDEILRFFSENPDTHYSVSQITQQFSAYQTSDVTKILQQLIYKANIRQVQEDDQSFRYIYIPEHLSPKFAGLTPDHHKIYNLIEKKGNMGIWRRELKKQSGIEERQITTILSELESRQLVKTTPSIQDKKLKLYILYDLVPSAEITGGIWYLEGKFDTPFVEHLLENMIKKVNEEQTITPNSMRNWIKESGVSRVRLSDDDCNQAIQAMIHTGKVAMASEFLVPGPKVTATCPISKLPCCQCPRFEVCEPGGVINPVDCPYLDKMTELF